MKIIETDRLILRKINQNDYKEMKSILQNKDLMIIGWGKTYSDDEVQTWINKIMEQYEKYGYSYYIVIEKNSNSVIGIMGIIPVNIKNTDYIEIAYILKQEYWGNGYATEGIEGCISYAFSIFNADKIIAQVIPENKSSIKVLERLGMKFIDEYVRDYGDKKSLHLIYELMKEQYIKKFCTKP